LSNRVEGFKIKNRTNRTCIANQNKGSFKLDRPWPENKKCASPIGNNGENAIAVLIEMKADD